MLKFSTIILLTLMVTGCAHLREDATPNLGRTLSKSILWIQSSAEYRANCLQVYNLATKSLDMTVNSNAWIVDQRSSSSSYPPAVVLDVDETVLDNSPYLARLVLENDTFSPTTWDQWVALQQAPAIPGAIEFIQHANHLGMEIVFITNRACRKREGVNDSCPQKSDTIKNLEKMGFANVDPSNIFLKNEKKGWSSEKESRREIVSQKYRIVMFVGDDLGDFLPNVKKNITPVERELMVTEHSEKWGTFWFILPNPEYGSWLTILKKPRNQYLREY